MYTKKRRLSGRILATGVILLMCAVMITTAMVAPGIQHNISPVSPNTVLLQPGADAATVGLNDYSEARAYLELSEDMLGVPSGGTAANNTANIDMRHNAKSWTQLSRLGIFPGGDDKAGIIAPGVDGTYAFEMVNGARFPAVFTMSISEENEMDVPLEYRLRKEDKYVLGSADEWITLGDPVAMDGNIGSTAEQKYELDWRWKYYDSDSGDVKDTSLGFGSAEEPIMYKLALKINAVQSGGDDDTPVTGYDSPLIIMLCAAAISAVAILVLLLGRRRKQEEQTENV